MSRPNFRLNSGEILENSSRKPEQMNERKDEHGSVLTELIIKVLVGQATYKVGGFKNVKLLKIENWTNSCKIHFIF